MDGVIINRIGVKFSDTATGEHSVTQQASGGMAGKMQTWGPKCQLPGTPEAFVRGWHCNLVAEWLGCSTSHPV